MRRVAEYRRLARFYGEREARELEPVGWLLDRLLAMYGRHPRLVWISLAVGAVWALLAR